jgi:signal transduction histidine kinase
MEAGQQRSNIELQQQLEALRQELARTRERLRQETALRKEIEASAQRDLQKCDEFIAAATHDLGTPLAPVISFAELCLMEDCVQDAPELRELLGMVKGQADKTLTMLRKLSAYGQTGFLPRPDQPVDAESVLEVVLAELQGYLSHRKLEVVTTGLEPLRIPEQYLKAALKILLANAIEHSDVNRAPIEIGIRRAKDAMQLFVRDHGIGLSEELNEEIFQIFPRNRGSEGGKGIGTGLATLRKIAGFYGGRAWVEPTAGGGCTFRVEFGEPTTT